MAIYIHNTIHSTFCFVFQTNERVKDESRCYGDILQENFIETYNNLTIKSLMMVKFVAVYEPKAQLVFKVFIKPLFSTVTGTFFFNTSHVTIYLDLNDLFYVNPMPPQGGC